MLGPARATSGRAAPPRRPGRAGRQPCYRSQSSADRRLLRRSRAPGGRATRSRLRRIARRRVPRRAGRLWCGPRCRAGRRRRTGRRPPVRVVRRVRRGRRRRPRTTPRAGRLSHPGGAAPRAAAGRGRENGGTCPSSRYGPAPPRPRRPARPHPGSSGVHRRRNALYSRRSQRCPRRRSGAVRGRESSAPAAAKHRHRAEGEPAELGRPRSVSSCGEIHSPSYSGA